MLDYWTIASKGVDETVWAGASWLACQLQQISLQHNTQRFWNNISSVISSYFVVTAVSCIFNKSGKGQERTGVKVPDWMYCSMKITKLVQLWMIPYLWE